MFPATEYVWIIKTITIQIAKICVYSPGLAQKHKAFYILRFSIFRAQKVCFQVPELLATQRASENKIYNTNHIIIKQYLMVFIKITTAGHSLCACLSVPCLGSRTAVSPTLTVMSNMFMEKTSYMF